MSRTVIDTLGTVTIYHVNMGQNAYFETVGDGHGSGQHHHLHHSPDFFNFIFFLNKGLGN